MLKRLIRWFYTDAPGILLKVLTTAFAAATLLFFVGYSLMFVLEDGCFGLFGNGLGVALDQAPWVDVGTVSAWEVYDLDNYALLLLYSAAALLFRYGIFVAAAIALLWTLLRLITRRAALDQGLRYIKLLTLIQFGIPLAYGIIVAAVTGVFEVGTWVHTPLLEVSPGNILFCVLIPLLYLLVCTALCYLIIALPLLIFKKIEKKKP